MDFLTAFPYWAIFLIVVINAWIVSRMHITIEQENTSEKPEK